jgi:hypothetical protein
MIVEIHLRGLSRSFLPLLLFSAISMFTPEQFNLDLCRILPNTPTQPKNFHRRNNDNVLPSTPISRSHVSTQHLLLSSLPHHPHRSHLNITSLDHPNSSFQTTPTLTSKLSTRAIDSTHVRLGELVTHDCCTSRRNEGIGWLCGRYVYGC